MALDLSRTGVSDVSDMPEGESPVTDNCSPYLKVSSPGSSSSVTDRGEGLGLVAMSARQSFDAFMASFLPQPQPHQCSENNCSRESSVADVHRTAKSSSSSHQTQDSASKSFAVDTLMGLSQSVSMAMPSINPYSFANVFDMSTPLHVAALAQERRRLAATLSPSLDLDRQLLLPSASDVGVITSTASNNGSNLIPINSLLFSQGQGCTNNFSQFSPLFNFEHSTSTPSSSCGTSGKLVSEETAAALDNTRAYFALPLAPPPPSQPPHLLGGRQSSLLVGGSRSRPATGGEDTAPDANVKRPRLADVTAADLGQDDSYWERRRKNNEAAKRSRDARRIKEEKIAMRAAFLEQENLKLRAQVALLKTETAKLHVLLYNRV